MVIHWVVRLVVAAGCSVVCAAQAGLPIVVETPALRRRRLLEELGVR